MNFVDTLGFSIVLPFLVFLVTRLDDNTLIYGLLGAAYSFFQLIGVPILDGGQTAIRGAGRPWLFSIR